MAVLTRGSRKYTEAALSAAGLAGYFPKRVCRDDHPDEEAKPNPIAMARAAGMMELAKDRCILVGDHPTDMECARSAGSSFVGVLSGATDRSGWNELGEVIIIPDVSTLPALLNK
jgi:phosphoglycolate phosphatase-like HAD superfamily hydrolase